MALNPLPHQLAGRDFLSSKNRCGLFDEPGVGKTAQAIFALDKIGAFRVVIVCPAAVRQVWKGEIRKFAVIPRRVLQAKNIHDLGVWLKGKADVLILSYELASKWAEKMEGDLFDCLIFDEAHYLKTPTAQRTRNMLGTHCDGANGLARWAANVWWMTGTPLPNDPVDIWPFLRFTGGTTLGLTSFTNRYFKSQMGTFSAKQTPRAEMVAELKMAINAMSLRRTKTQAGLHLPPIHLTTTTVEGDTAEIAALLREWPGLEQVILDAIEQGGLSFLDAQHIATLRRLVGAAKAPPYALLVAEELKNGVDKRVIFTWHTRAAEIITSHLAGEGHWVTLMDGSTPERSRVDFVKSFQEDPDHRVFIANIKSCGTGLTLTAAADLDMFESSWAPADNAQALFRVHRIGQGRKVNARFVSLANSIDELVAETVARKTAAIAMIENYGEAA